MNIIWLPLLVSIFSIESINSMAFCDVLSFDNVFNVGHLIHMTRCGEVWTYDPRLNGNSSGFYRDYSWYAFGRRIFGRNIEHQHQTYDDKYLRFAAFSFQDIFCMDGHVKLERFCHESAAAWNHLSVMVDNYTAITFRYDYELRFRNDSVNPLKFPAIQNMKSNPRTLFWPDLDIIGGRRYKLEKGLGSIHSALFSHYQQRLFMVLLSVDEKYFCFTHLDMKEMLFDFNEWPKTIINWNHTKREVFPERWAPAMCITGSVVGMFEDKEKVYVVGRVSYESRDFEDQLYTLDATEGTQVRISPTYENGGQIPRTLRTYFGCPVVNLTQQKPQTRRKRSLQKSKQTIDFSYKSIIKELKEDWLQLSVMSVIAIVLLSFIIKFS